MKIPRRIENWLSVPSQWVRVKVWVGARVRVHIHLHAFRHWYKCEEKILWILCYVDFGNHGTVGELRKNSYFSVLGHPSRVKIFKFNSNASSFIQVYKYIYKQYFIQRIIISRMIVYMEKVITGQGIAGIKFNDHNCPKNIVPRWPTCIVIMHPNTTNVLIVNDHSGCNISNIIVLKAAKSPRPRNLPILWVFLS